VAARSIASLTVSFGLVAIPVKLYSATVATGRISFNLLHKKDGSRLKQQYICQKEEKVVERDEIVKGYEFAKDQYVMFTPEEIQALEEAGSQSINVEEFVPLAAVDPVYFDRTYYLAPDKGGAKPYTLFAQALRESGRCAVGRWATRGREYVVILRPMENGLAMQQLHFSAEVRPISEIELEDAVIRENELKLARQLIDQQTSDTFDPTGYVDQVKTRIEAAIQQKIQGQEISLSEPPPAGPDKVIDLMAALRASIDRSAGGKAAVDRATPDRAVARRAPTQLGKRKGPKRVQKRPVAAKSKKASRVP
jgi:DNA end-binding protein Ku